MNSKGICVLYLLRFITYLSFTLISGAACSESSESKNDSVSIASLKKSVFHSSLKSEKELIGAEGYYSILMSYHSDGLKLFTLVNIPLSDMPKKGFPVLIFGHGYHPNPKQYGVSTKTGKNSRPGDYYRGIPESYAKQGFIVLTPDYRGHNESEGFEYTQTKFLASSYYAIDVLNLIAALPSLPNADISNIYYLGHSLGGDVGLKVLLASNKIRAASLWAPVIATTHEQALYYSKEHDKMNIAVNLEKMKQYTQEIDDIYSSLPFELTYEEVDPINFTNDISTPLIIHHAIGDVSVPYMWSERFIVKLYKYAKIFAFFAYDSENHLFQSDERKAAVERDVAFFKIYAN